MKKLSYLLVLMLIALMLFVSCNNNTSVKERVATKEDMQMVSNLLGAVMYMAGNYTEEQGVKVDSKTNTVTFKNAKGVDEVSGDVVVVLNGTATMSEEVMILDLGSGTQYYGKGHTIYAKANLKTGEEEIIIDGYKLTDIDKVQLK